MSDMMSDLRAFELRKKDTGRKVKLLTYGEISDRYTFICFDENVIRNDQPQTSLTRNSAGKNKVPIDFLDYLYTEQKIRYEGRQRINYRNRDLCKINVGMTIAQEEWLKKSVADKEDTASYLCEKYKSLLAEHKKITLLPFAFYLPDDWIQKHEDPHTQIFSHDALKTSLEELQRRFDEMTKRLKQQAKYDPACAYTRLIVIDEKFKPFYLVNFFFSVDDLNAHFAEDIWFEWLATSSSSKKEKELAVFYAFDDEYKPDRNDVEGLMFHVPEAGIISLYNAQGDNAWKILLTTNQYSSPEPLKNDRKRHEQFFRLQAQKYNTIPGSRAKVFSDNFTYSPSGKRKKTEGQK
ncbi:hypothetical protein [Enterobacter asburiae]|uniref:hypothetical protein n=1 Tax=Enterobacter asburiae TaxID=61645 RepID=UPI0011D1FCEC|nr:hypothetical protein [Enterobacter asburiae]